MDPASRRHVILGWVITRAVLVLVAVGVLPYVGRSSLTHDPSLYWSWTPLLLHGHFPAGDPQWQYPPGAAVILVFPRLFPGGYLPVFVTFSLIVDAFVLKMILRSTREDDSAAGAWAWVIGVACLGPLVMGRYDLMVTALAVAALLNEARPSRFGLLTGLGAMTKVWPVALLAGMRPGRSTRRGLLWTAATVGAVMLAALAATSGSLSFLTEQDQRGLQAESVAATPFVVARFFGWSGGFHHQFGADEVVGPGVSAVARLCLAASILSIGYLLLWRRRARWGDATARDAALTATLLFVATSRVLSPQYLIWLVGLAALCLARRDSGQRRIAAAVVVIAAVTQLEYPLYWPEILKYEGAPTVILVVRNTLVVATTVMSCVALWRSTVPARDRGALAHSGDEALAPAGAADGAVPGT